MSSQRDGVQPMTAPRSEPGGGVTAPRRSVTVAAVVGGRPLVAKRVKLGARRRLRREAELLDHLQDLPVVQLVARRTPTTTPTW